MLTRIIVNLGFILIVVSAGSTNALDKISCQYPDSFDITNFPTHATSLQDKSLEIGPQICKNLLEINSKESMELDRLIATYSSLAGIETQTIFKENEFPGVARIMDDWKMQVRDFRSTTDYLNPVKFVKYVGPIDLGASRIKLNMKLPPHNQNNLQFTLTEKLNNACITNSNGLSCDKAGESLENAIKPAFTIVRSAMLGANGELLSEMQKDWQKFINNSRYQTPLDVWATTYFQRNDFNGLDLVGPPNSQLFLLHPMLVYEHVDDVEKGNKEDVSLAIEWAGINWWRAGIGLSLTSVYNDRVEVKSVGHGITLHVNNKYSLGYVRRSDGNDSIFINFDILEWFGDKKEKYTKYKKYF